MVLDTIDADIDLSKKTSTTWKELRKSVSLSNFLDTHCKLGTYKVTIMKCEDPACKFHKPRRLSNDEWRDLHPFPDAQLVQNGSKVLTLLACKDATIQDDHPFHECAVALPPYVLSFKLSMRSGEVQLLKKTIQAISKLKSKRRTRHPRSCSAQNMLCTLLYVLCRVAKNPV